MRCKEKTRVMAMGIFIVMALAALPAAFNCPAQAAATMESGKTDVDRREAPALKAVPPAGSLTGITVSFKLDPRMTRGMYMGDRWVSPPTFAGVQEGKEFTVEARARGLDARGGTRDINPTWIPEDPGMVAVAAAKGNDARITVKRAGESKLKVASSGFSRELIIKAKYEGDAIHVEIEQSVASVPAGIAAAQYAPALKSREEKISYALGMSIASNLPKDSPELDRALVVKGFQDALSGGTTLLTREEGLAAVALWQNELKKKQPAMQSEQAKALAEQNKKDGETFLAGNATREGVVTLASGLQYRILKAGDGKKPTLNDTVACHYRGTLINGTEFDSSHKRKRPAILALKNVINGWKEALQLMPAGSKWQLFIPPHLAYGERGSGRGIGPYTTLIFEVELISIK